MADHGGHGRGDNDGARTWLPEVLPWQHHFNKEYVPSMTDIAFHVPCNPNATLHVPLCVLSPIQFVWQLDPDSI